MEINENFSVRRIIAPDLPKAKFLSSPPRHLYLGINGKFSRLISLKAFALSIKYWIHELRRKHSEAETKTLSYLCKNFSPYLHLHLLSSLSFFSFPHSLQEITFCNHKEHSNKLGKLKAIYYRIKLCTLCKLKSFSSHPFSPYYESYSDESTSFPIFLLV